jgi:hypothetical protein
VDEWRIWSKARKEGSSVIQWKTRSPALSSDAVALSFDDII